MVAPGPGSAGRADERAVDAPGVGTPLQCRQALGHGGRRHRRGRARPHGANARTERSIETTLAVGEDDGRRRERSFDEVVALHYGEWVLMKVLEVDDYDVPTRGIVIAHSPDRDAVSPALRREPPRQPEAPYQPYYTFSAFPRVRPGETFEQAAERFAAERAAVEAARGD